MATVRPLPDAVRSSVRSGIFLFDFARVVEELVFNSLDAHATKVSVFVSVGSCYLKVVDDGSGITRDGLELVGERYATSKFLNLADLNATSEYFGFRGEALASISEVSLLEIVTRTYGRANGYQKVLKGCKCLYLGIDDDRKDVGTTGDNFGESDSYILSLYMSGTTLTNAWMASIFPELAGFLHDSIGFRVIEVLFLHKPPFCLQTFNLS